MNRIKEAIKERGYALGAATLTTNPDLIEVMGKAGLDFIWVDLQHSGCSPYDSNTIINLLRAAELNNCTLLVRLPHLEFSMIGKVLDCGVKALLIPEVKDQRDIDLLIKAGRFNVGEYDGFRSSGTCRASEWLSSTYEQLVKANEDIMLGVMLENKEILDSLGSSVHLKGIDFAFFGPSDLSLSLNLKLDRTHPIILEYRKKMLDYCKSLGVYPGIGIYDIEAAKKAIKEGFKLITIASDLQLIFREIKSRVEALRKI
ncbi:5-keto-4-deoxy-D-glucarate aldolase [archaeon HR06]|nr:5-keto-4-deoxy-D-glucarate aldolase [archaeon HR06]